MNHSTNKEYLNQVSVFLNAKIRGTLIVKDKIKFEALVGSSIDLTNDLDKTPGENLREIKVVTKNPKENDKGSNSALSTSTSLTYEYPLFKIFSKNELLEKGNGMTNLTKEKNESRSKESFLKDLKGMLMKCKKSKECWYSELTGMFIPSVLKESKSFQLFVDVFERIQGGYFLKKYNSLELEYLSSKFGICCDFLFRFFWKSMTLAERNTNKGDKWLFKDALEIVFKELILKNALLNSMQRYCSNDNRLDKRFNRQSAHQHQWLVDREKISQALASLDVRETRELSFSNFVRTMEEKCSKLLNLKKDRGERGVMYPYNPTRLTLTTQIFNFKSLVELTMECGQLIEELEQTSASDVEKKMVNKQLTAADAKIIIETFSRTFHGLKKFINWHQSEISILSPNVESAIPGITICYDCQYISDSEKNIYDHWKLVSKKIPKETKKEDLMTFKGENKKNKKNEIKSDRKKKNKWALREAPRQGSKNYKLEFYSSDSSFSEDSEESEYDPINNPKVSKQPDEDIVDFDNLTDLDSDEESQETEDYEDDMADGETQWETYVEESFDENDEEDEEMYKLEKRNEKRFKWLYDRDLEVNSNHPNDVVIDLTKGEKRKRVESSDMAPIPKRRKMKGLNSNAPISDIPSLSQEMNTVMKKIITKMSLWHEDSWDLLPAGSAQHGSEEVYYWKLFFNCVEYWLTKHSTSYQKEEKELLFKHLREIHIQRTKISTKLNGVVYSLLYTPSAFEPMYQQTLSLPHNVRCSRSIEMLNDFNDIVLN